MQSNGGSISATTAMRESVRTILSGPAGGVVGAQHVAELAGFPRRIECFDVSNLHGRQAVASRVVFIGGEPAKTLYRHYRVHRMTAKASRTITSLFEAFINDPRLMPDEAREKARAMGVNVVWDAELARTSEGYYPIRGGIDYAIDYARKLGIASHLNRDLSIRRAASVANYLKSQDVLPQRLATRGMGPSSPIASNATSEGRALNRRVEIVLIPIT